MSLKDVCELSSLLQGGDKETEKLEKEALAKESLINSQEGRLQHELDEYDKVIRNQTSLETNLNKSSQGLDVIDAALSHLYFDTNSTGSKLSLINRQTEISDLYQSLLADVDTNSRIIDELEEEILLCSNKTITELKRTLSEEETKQAEYTTAYEALKFSLNDILQQLLTQRSKNETLEALFTCKNEEVHSLNSRKEGILSDITSIQKSIELHENDCKHRIEVKLQELQAIQTDANEYICTLKAIDLKGDEICASIDTTTAVLNKLNNDIMYHKDGNTTLYNNIKAVTLEINEMSSTVDAKSKVASELQNELTRLLHDIDRQKIREEMFQPRQFMIATNSNYQKEYDEVTDNLARMNQQINECKQHIANPALHPMMKGLIASIESCKQIIIDIQLEVDESNANIDILHDKKKEMQQQMKDIEVEREHLSSTLAASVKKRDELVAAIQAIGGNSNDSCKSRDLKQLNEEYQCAIETKKEAEDKLDNSEEELKVLVAKRSKIEKDLQLLDKKKVASFDKEDDAFYKAEKESQINQMKTLLIAKHKSTIEKLNAQLSAEDAKFQENCKQHDRYKERKALLSTELNELRKQWNQINANKNVRNNVLAHQFEHEDDLESLYTQRRQYQQQQPQQSQSTQKRHPPSQPSFPDSNTTKKSTTTAPMSNSHGSRSAALTATPMKQQQYSSSATRDKNIENVFKLPTTTSTHTISVGKKSFSSVQQLQTGREALRDTHKNLANVNTNTTTFIAEATGVKPFSKSFSDIEQSLSQGMRGKVGVKRQVASYNDSKSSSTNPSSSTGSGTSSSSVTKKYKS